MHRPVYISGMGAVSALGLGVSALADAVFEGKSGVRPISFGENKQQFIKTAASLPEIPLEKNPRRTTSSNVDIVTTIGLLAAKEAMEQAKWPEGMPLGQDAAVIVGTGIGALATLEVEYHKHFVTGGRSDPFTIPKVMPSASASHISMAYGAQGPSFSVSSACSSSSQAIGVALSLIRSGMARRAIVGGTEALLTHTGFRAWEALRVMSPTLCRPFSKGRDGMILGEGAAIMLIETEDALKQRGGEPICELAGFGTTSDAADILRPDAASCARAMRNALIDAGLSPQDIGYLNAHGTGTILNDQTETLAMQEIFGDQLAQLPVSSTKPVHGHTLGAAGAIELIVTIEALRRQMAPPTINWLEADAHCIANPVPNQAVPTKMNAAMSNSFAFGGINSCLVVRKV
nr:beta-ketoacyl-[acyl-carrier-protein] synthase family protein [Aestuariivirga litoralis]